MKKTFHTIHVVKKFRKKKNHTKFESVALYFNGLIMHDCGNFEEKKVENNNVRKQNDRIDYENVSEHVFVDEMAYMR